MVTNPNPARPQHVRGGCARGRGPRARWSWSARAWCSRTRSDWSRAASAPTSCPPTATTPVANGLTIRAPFAAAVAGAGCFGDGGAVALHRPAGDRKFWLFLAPDVLSNDHVTRGGQRRSVAAAARPAPQAGLVRRRLRPTSPPETASPSPRSSPAGSTRHCGCCSSAPLRSWSGAGGGSGRWCASRCRSWCAPPSRRRAAAGSTTGPGTVATPRRSCGTRRSAGSPSTSRCRSDAPMSEIVHAVAARTGRRTDEVHALLAPATVANDSALADLGRRLLQLEDEVRRR